MGASKHVNVALNFQHLAADPEVISELKSQSEASRKTSGFCDYYFQHTGHSPCIAVSQGTAKVESEGHQSKGDKLFTFKKFEP